jgi:hypothetical protein
LPFLDALSAIFLRDNAMAILHWLNHEPNEMKVPGSYLAFLKAGEGH